MIAGGRSSARDPLAAGAEAAGVRLPSGATGAAVELRPHGELRARFRAGAVRSVRLSVPAPVATPAYNVVGVLRGVGTPEAPGLADEVVVFTAHYDHLGERAPSPGQPADTDRIYNGADDDASGVVAVLELAEALAADEPPARTLVFLLVTGEERGLLGTRYYIENPVFPLERMVCNLNFEMIGRPDELSGGPGHMWLTGYERSNLGEAFAGAGLAVAPDRRPEERFFQRSDNIAFAMRGIVAQTLSSFNLHEEYHTVRDEADTLDFAHMTACARAGLEAARMLAGGELQPEWKPGGNPERR